MQKKLTLSIPTPCHENWNNMQASEQGRFCLSCQKEVVDFSVMSDAEVFNFFTKRTAKNVCGRVATDQMNHPIVKPVEHKKKKFWYVSYLTTLLLIINKSKADAQVKAPVETSPTPVNKNVWLGKIAAPNPQAAYVITGTITDAEHAVIPFASVIIKGSKFGTTTDSKGMFSIRVRENDILQFSSIGYNVKEISIKDRSSMNVVLKQSRMMLEGEVVVVGSMSFEEDVVGYDQPRHIAKILVKDKNNGSPVKAKIFISKNGNKDRKTVSTNANGQYELKRIKEDQDFTLMVTAEGYRKEEITISGEDFKQKRMAKLVMLEKESPVRMKMGEMKIQDPAVCRPPVIVPVTTAVKKDTVLSAIKSNTFFHKITTIFNKPTINVYPNPIMSSTNTTVQLLNFPKGSYFLNVVNAAGQTISSQSFIINNKKQTANIGSDAIKFSGVYVISVVNTSSKKIITAKLIVQ